MNKFQINETNINGLYIIEPAVYKDMRGELFEAYNVNEFIQSGLNERYVQDNEVFSKKGVLRGMHINNVKPQAKLIRVVYGAIYDVVVDLRKDSITYGKYFGIELSEENKKQLYIPKGMGHGYLSLADSRIIFKVSDHFVADGEIGFAYNSKSLSIKWPKVEGGIILNERDKNNPDIAMLDI